MEHALDNILHVQLREEASAEQLGRILAPDWDTTIQPWDYSWIVAIELRHEPHDLALLLRAVERWGAARGLLRIPFHLDGREYGLRVSPLTGSTVPA